MSEREKFWQAEENREQERIAEERQRKASEAQKLDADRKRREEEETKAREALIKDREQKISAQFRGAAKKMKHGLFCKSGTIFSYQREALVQVP